MPSVSGAAASKPNILFLMADRHRGDCPGATPYMYTNARLPADRPLALEHGTPAYGKVPGLARRAAMIQYSPRYPA